MSQLKYIIIQLEQLSFNGGWFHDKQKYLVSDTLPMMQNALQVWDYDQNNIEFLSNFPQFNIKPYLIPFGFNSNFQKVKLNQNKDVDVLFYGWALARREKIINKLEKMCKFIHAYGIYGQKRDELISRSKIVLNIHNYENVGIFEQVRVFYLFINKSFVISENSKWSPYDDRIVTFPYDQIIEGVMYWLNRPKEREEIANQGPDILKKVDTQRLIENALSKLDFF